jgi:sugar phosphate isomerase/epimerase
MQPAISTQVFLSQRLHPGLLEAMRLGGATTIELFADRSHFDYTDRAVLREISRWFGDTGVGATLHQPLATESVWSRHSGPTINLISNEKMQRIEAMDEVKRAMECAETIPVKSCVLHLGMSNEAWTDAALEHSLTAIEHLKAFATPLGVKLLIENLRNEVTTPERLLAILRIGHFDSVGVCFDAGHANISEAGIAATFELLKGRIAEVHLHDNHGTKDEHLWPASGTERSKGTASGTIDWGATYAMLAGLPNDVPGVLEIKHELNETTDSVTRISSEVYSHGRRLMEVREDFLRG